MKEDIIGEERANLLLPLKTTENEEIKFSLHADQPMFESKPFRLIQTAVERQTKEGDTINFSQSISTLKAIKSMTIDAAWQLHMEDKIGSLKVGKYADFVVVDKNPLKIESNKLENIKVLQAFVNGNKVN